MALIESIIARAKSNKQRIVLPESLEERTLTAADKSLADDIADIILIGNPDEIFALADKLGLKNIGKATIIDPATSDKTEEYAQLLFQLRQKCLIGNRKDFGCQKTCVGASVDCHRRYRNTGRHLYDGIQGIPASQRCGVHGNT